MKILVLAETYPMPDGKVCPMYIHMRNRYYADQGADVTVLNFRAQNAAEYDGIKVITLDDYKNHHKTEVYDFLVLHAANIKHHYRFLKKYGRNFPHFVFVFHGHEVLRKSTVYPPLFPWKKQKNALAVTARNLYDTFKLNTWRKLFENDAFLNKTDAIFVSQWMLDEFLKNTGVKRERIGKHAHVIYNGVGKVFVEHEYVPQEENYDFVTIRRNIDGEKYCVDVVNALAEKNPQYKFLVVGRGQLFSHVKKADNLVWQDRNLYHNEMFDVLNQCRYALMPTKTDAQGLMMCEMATFGIPVVTSDIPVCHEVLDDFDNVAFISNTGVDDLAPVVDRLEPARVAPVRNDKFLDYNTSGKEYELLCDILKK